MNSKNYNAIVALSVVALLAACGEGKKEEKAPEAPAVVSESSENKTDEATTDEKAAEKAPEAESTQQADVPEDATDVPAGETKSEETETK